VGVGLLLDAQVPIQDLNQVEPLSYPAKSDEKTMSGGGRPYKVSVGAGEENDE